LIEIPYWWDFKLNSLAATLKFVRNNYNFPDYPGGTVIPQKPPKHRDDNRLMHGENWSGSFNLKGWWISEKFDGIRAHWDGSTFLSRNGRPLKIPRKFAENMPEIELDGELYTGNFDEISRIVKSDSQWERVKYVVFDSPAFNLKFEDRIRQIRSLDLPDHVVIATHFVCQSNDQILEETKKVIARGGKIHRKFVEI
jgi:DNA ligase 1